MLQRNYIKAFNLLLLAMTTVALAINHHVFGLIVLNLWAFKGMFKVFKAAVDGGAFN